MRYQSKKRRKRKKLLKNKQIFLILMSGIGLIASLYSFWTYRSYLGFASYSQINTDDIVVGAIRFDAWFSPPNFETETRIEDPKWHSRLPFYAKKENGTYVIRGDEKIDGEKIVDKEIQYAAKGGLDYWAFDYYGIYGLKPRTENSAYGGMHYGLRDYLASEHRDKLNFALNVTGEWIFNGGSENATRWDKEFVPTVIKLMKEPGYQTVLSGRPLIFIYKMDKAAEKLGGEQELAKALTRLRNAAKRNGLNDPYIVGSLWGYTHPVERITKYGVDAVSAYTAHRGNDYNNGKLWPYSSLAESNVKFWDRLAFELPGNKQTAGIIPLVNVGWDPRPNIESGTDDSAIDTYKDSPLYKHAKPWEIGNHLVTAVEWIRSHPTQTRAKTILIYSWSEYPEGGIIAPTLDEGDSRLRAIAKALGRAENTKPKNQPIQTPTPISSPIPSNKPLEKRHVPTKPLYIEIKKLNESLQINWKDNFSNSDNFKTYWVAIRKNTTDEVIDSGSTQKINNYNVPYSKLNDGEYIVRVQALYQTEERILQSINIKVEGNKIWVIR